jgi:hypothetical protein
MFKPEEIEVNIKKIEECIRQYREGAVWANEMAAVITDVAVEIFNNTPSSPIDGI